MAIQSQFLMNKAAISRNGDFKSSIDPSGPAFINMIPDMTVKIPCKGTTNSLLTLEQGIMHWHRTTC